MAERRKSTAMSRLMTTSGQPDPADRSDREHRAQHATLARPASELGNLTFLGCATVIHAA